jgi:hypothetical protein
LEIDCIIIRGLSGFSGFSNFSGFLGFPNSDDPRGDQRACEEKPAL